MNLARSSIRVFLARATSTLLAFLGLTFFARELGAHQIGIFFLFQAILGMISIPADFGINKGVTKRLSENKSGSSVLTTAIILKLLFLLPLVIAILLFQEFINNYLGAKLAFYLVIGLTLQETAKLTMQVLKGELRVGEIAGPTISYQVVYVGLGALLVLMGFGVKSIIYSLLAGFAIKLTWGAWKILTKPGSPSIGQARSLLDYSKYAFISSVGGYVYSWMDILVIGIFLTQSSVGVYEIAWRVTTVVMLFSNSIATTIFPQVSQWDANNATERIESMLPKAIAPIFFFVIPAFLGVVLFSRDILRYVFGPEYATGWLVLIILMGEKVIQSVHIILGRSLPGINRPDLSAKAVVVALMLNLLLNLILVFEYGIIGAAIATTISFLANSLLHYYYLSKYLTIRIPYAQIRGCIIASIGMFLVLYAVESIIEINSIQHLILIVLFGVATYFIFAIIIPSSREIIINNVKRAAA